MTIKKTRKQLIIEVETLQQEVASLKQLVSFPFPFSSTENQAPHPLIDEPITSVNKQEYTVVLVEDSETDRIIYSRYLKQHGQNLYRIIEFDNGEDALAWCQQTMPDILLIDFLLPDMNGLEFLQHLYQQTNQSWIPAIIITGQENIELAVTLLKNGAQDYLVKNHITPISLHQAIAKVLQQQQLIQQQIWQQQQQQLVTNTALAIRSSFKLKDILQTAVTQVRQILQTNRVIIYQFQPDWSGIVTTESTINPALSILGQTIKDNCFETTWVEQYQKGRIRVIDDIHTDANLAECHREFLASFQIQANLVIPIIQTDNLWGLLIAHECYAPRHWTKAECELMNQLAIQIGIAIQKATLFEELQAQLEKYRQLVSIVENSSDFIATANLNGQVQYINPAGQCLLGLENTDVQQTTIWEYQTSEWNQSFQQQIIPSVISTGRWEGEWQMQNFQTGELIPVWCNIFTLKNQITGQPHTIATVTRDIRERKQAEERLKNLNAELELRVVERTSQLVQANNKLQKELFQREKLERQLRQSEQLLEGFFQAASQVNIGLGIVDKDFYFLKVNQTLAQINGHTIAAHYGKSFGDLLPEIASKLLPLLQNLIDTQQPISNLEISGIVPSEPEVLRYWQLSYFPIIGESHKTIALGAIVLDISDRRSDY
ncbi:hypothetical protein CLI64_25650 [Nostoc sp. CENA543]|uniref:GAF domain-containing protein n=1 Tax=Nostoc sp. CENA543 TaxID=1869241 RepID=UPI000CA0EDD7|nr:GAF domain-containing protein [Nostoc sp. CENA543]AUT03516.1 hypothetical protein CLI64_25650 [Nostoc sp. CENA543]